MTQDGQIQVSDEIADLIGETVLSAAVDRLTIKETNCTLCGGAIAAGPGEDVSIMAWRSFPPEAGPDQFMIVTGFAHGRCSDSRMLRDVTMTPRPGGSDIEWVYGKVDGGVPIICFEAEKQPYIESADGVTLPAIVSHLEDRGWGRVLGPIDEMGVPPNAPGWELVDHGGDALSITHDDALSEVLQIDRSSPAVDGLLRELRYWQAAVLVTGAGLALSSGNLERVSQAVQVGNVVFAVVPYVDEKRSAEGEVAG